MKKPRFSEKEIMPVLKQAAADVKVTELVHKNDISEATFYNWKAKFNGVRQPALMPSRLIDLAPLMAKRYRDLARP